MPRRPTQTSPNEQQLFRDDVGTYKFDRTDVDILSLIHKFAARVEMNPTRQKTSKPRQKQSPPAKQTAALWCKACRTKGHSSPAFSEFCSIRRLRKERNGQQPQRGQKLPRIEVSRHSDPARKWLAISAYQQP